MERHLKHLLSIKTTQRPSNFIFPKYAAPQILPPVANCLFWLCINPPLSTGDNHNQLWENQYLLSIVEVTSKLDCEQEDPES